MQDVEPKPQYMFGVTSRDTDSDYRALTAALWLEQVENGHKKSGSM